MKGSTGTSMQGREYRKKKRIDRKKSVYCKNCKNMELNASNKIMTYNSDKIKGKSKKQIYPYICKIRETGMFYTSEVICTDYEEIEVE